LTVRRAGVQEPWQVKLERQTFRPETVLGVIRHDNNAWDYWIDRRRKIAHVRIAGLASGTAMELRQVVAGLKDEGLRGILLDLRWCPGGFLNEALDVAQLFLGECTVASVKSRLQGEDTYRSVRDESKVLDVPLVVLVNAETSGGAELIAAALQDNGRARIAGQRTRGKASIQTTVGLPVPSTGLKLTSGTFLRPSGKNLHRFPDSKPGDDWGVRPDPGLEVRTSAALSRQLKEWWLLQTLRPGPSREALPLDDPHADPQRHAALQALVELIK
jgi:carboxyl-terminal processing protease